jgi:uncharacterized YccA/Bax inhibitor family protein
MSNRKGFFESRNPVMKENAFIQASQENALTGGATMTVQGAINKSLILGLIMLATAAFAYSAPSQLFLWGGAIGGFIVVLIMSFRPQLSPTLAPIYAGLEGLFVGAISAIYAGMLDGIIFQAVSLTFGVFFTMLFIFKSRIIKVDNKLRVGVMMATGAVALVYVVSIVLSLFGITMPYLHQAGPIGIGISLVIIAIAAMNLLLDFDNFEKGEMYRAPKYMEWFSAMGLLVTLVWLYLEILRLLSMLSRD